VSGNFLGSLHQWSTKVVCISIPVLLSPRQWILPHFPGKKDERSHKRKEDRSQSRMNSFPEFEATSNEKSKIIGIIVQTELLNFTQRLTSVISERSKIESKGY